MNLDVPNIIIAEIAYAQDDYGGEENDGLDASNDDSGDSHDDDSSNTDDDSSNTDDEGGDDSYDDSGNSYNGDIGDTYDEADSYDDSGEYGGDSQLTPNGTPSEGNSNNYPLYDDQQSPIANDTTPSMEPSLNPPPDTPNDLPPSSPITDTPSAVPPDQPPVNSLVDTPPDTPNDLPPSSPITDTPSAVPPDQPPVNSLVDTPPDTPNDLPPSSPITDTPSAVPPDQPPVNSLVDTPPDTPNDLPPSSPITDTPSAVPPDQPPVNSLVDTPPDTPNDLPPSSPITDTPSAVPPDQPPVNSLVDTPPDTPNDLPPSSPITDTPSAVPPVNSCHMRIEIHTEQCNGTLPTYDNPNVVSGNGTITIRKLASTSNELIPNSSYLITPNPYTITGGSYLVNDNDINDFDTTEGEVTLENIRFSPYDIQEVDMSNQSQNYILHDISISVNKNLPDPVINIVENHDLGKVLPYEQIPFQYIIELKNSVVDDPKLIADKYNSRGAELVYVFKHAFKGLTLRIMDDVLFKELANDPNVLSIEPDQEGHIASSSITQGTSFDQKSLQTIPTGLGRVDEFIENENQSEVGSVRNMSLLSSTSNINADIAIIDTGISNSHPDLNIYRSETFVENTTSANDDNGHGSHVAGTAARYR